MEATLPGASAATYLTGSSYSHIPPFFRTLLESATNEQPSLSLAMLAPAVLFVIGKTRIAAE